MGLRINFLVNEVAGGWEATDTRLGGTEESVVRWAEELVKRGHRVMVFCNLRNDLDIPHDHNGVGYWDRSEWAYTPGDVCICVKDSSHVPVEPTLYLTNETNADQLDLSKYLGVIWPSKWARDNIKVNNPKTFILPHGYDDTLIYPSEKMTKQCFYASSPDRGLETLLKVWPKVHEIHPDAMLIVTYGAQPQNVPNVMFMGDCDEETMNDIYKTSEFWCHPCSGGELFGITGIKAQASGCIPVVIQTMALSETVQNGFICDDSAEYEQLLIDALNTPSEVKEILREEMSAIHYDNWSDSTDKLLKIISSVL